MLTEAGQVAFRYADEIFSLGREFVDTLKGRASGTPAAPGRRRRRRSPGLLGATLPGAGLPAGPAGARGLPRGQVGRGVHAELALHRRRVIADGPARPDFSVRAFNHLLGECGTRSSLRRAGLDAAAISALARRRPFLLPGAPSTVRRALEQWFDSEDSARHVAEFDDSALAKISGWGDGRLRRPHGHRARVLHQYGCASSGACSAVRPAVLRLSVERKIKHPAVVAICKSARQDIFGQT